MIEQTIIPRPKDLGGFSVRRVLPHARRRMVGPFIFLDHMGPAVFAPGQGLDVRPHPHIGLATITYLFDGEILHRDSLGFVQPIRPGEVNWMTAGRGIVHSERTDPVLKAKGYNLHGLQIWVALPVEAEEVAPEFRHYDADDIPKLIRPGVVLSVIAGNAYGLVSPVRTFSPLFYVDAVISPGGRLEVPSDYAERALYLVSGAVRINGQDLTGQVMGVLTADQQVTIEATQASRIILIGGEPFPESRNIFWNFVSHSPERLEKAKQAWKEGAFPSNSRGNRIHTSAGLKHLTRTHNDRSK